MATDVRDSPNRCTHGRLHEFLKRFVRVVGENEIPIACNVTRTCVSIELAGNETFGRLIRAFDARFDGEARAADRGIDPDFSLLPTNDFFFSITYNRFAAHVYILYITLLVLKSNLSFFWM